MADKMITEEEQKKLLQLWENAKSGKDDDIDAFDYYREELGIDPDEVMDYLSVKIEPETEQERRKGKKGKPADERRTEEAIDIKSIASAYGVDIEKAEKEGDLEKGGLQEYLDERFVFAKHPDESPEEYRKRNQNAFEALGLNWFNKDDRAKVAKSISLAENLDSRQKIAEEVNEGALGLFRNLVVPRITERATKEILEGEESEEGSYAKDYALDVAENVLQSIAGPLGVAKLVKVPTAVSKIAKTSKAAGALKGGKSILNILAENARAPLTMETLDAALYDEVESPRGDFSGSDVAIGTGVNIVTPRLVQRMAGRSGRQVTGETASEIEQALKDIDESVKFSKLKKYIEPWLINKMGKSEYVRTVPGLSEVAEEQKKTEELRKKKSETERIKEEKWKFGFEVPSPGDRDYDDFVKWKKRQEKSLGRYLLSK